ncbi:hypothetical protein ACWD6R_23045 [Streptomyces sp. NPDC005151]
MTTGPLDELRADMETWGAPIKPHEVLDAADTVAQRLVDQHTRALNGAYCELAHLVAWLAALHPAVLTPAPDAGDGWHLVFVSAGGWQFSWPIAPADLHLFAHVEHVPADDERARWDGHTTDQKYLRMRTHTAVLCLPDDDTSTGSST